MIRIDYDNDDYDDNDNVNHCDNDNHYVYDNGRTYCGWLEFSPRLIIMYKYCLKNMLLGTVPNMLESFLDYNLMLVHSLLV